MRAADDSEDVPERLQLSGRWFSGEEILEIRRTCRSLRGLSRLELAQTLCEHLDWRSPNGTNKVQASLKALAKLEERGLVEVPQARAYCPPRAPTTEWSERSDPGESVVGSCEAFEPVTVVPVAGEDEQRWWRELVARWHYLGFRQGFGSRQAYFIWSGQLPGQPLGCLLYAVSAWKVACRDEWIGWGKQDRIARLHFVVNNSRFLILPWVQIKNLASRVLALSVHRVGDDWQARYGYRPVLLEAFVDHSRFQGTCYRAANWISLGLTVGTSRTYRVGDPLGARKEMLVYPLREDFREVLRGEVSP